MKPIKIYSEHIEAEALAQFESAMGQDFAVKGALMPDAHAGYSLPIGGVVATQSVVVPSWVGYDIGCGMLACKLEDADEADIRNRAKEIATEIYKAVPVGFDNNGYQVNSLLNDQDLTPNGRAAFRYRGGFAALGTLGGGNHFIEIGCDSNKEVWVVIHCGSRGPGWETANTYMKLASGSTKALEGHYGLADDSQLGVEYINDMNWMLAFALENRKHILYRVADAIGLSPSLRGLVINRNHNHAVLKDGLWVHRKGATHAEKDMMGVIPGNMRDGTFIVKGLGNPDSLCSSSHGAGRVLSRSQAKKTLTLEEFSATMVGVEAKVEASTLDESPMSYKDIFRVMAEQADLVSIVQHIRPIINIKG